MSAREDEHHCSTLQMQPMLLEGGHEAKQEVTDGPAGDKAKARNPLHPAMLCWMQEHQLLHSYNAPALFITPLQEVCVGI